MPTKIPNFLNNTNSPLGTAFANLHQALASAPSEADAQKSADDAVLSHWKMLGMQGMGTQLQNGFPADAPAPVGTGAPAVSPVTPSVPVAVPQPGASAASPIAAKIAQLAPQAQAQGPDPRDIVEGPSSPIAATVANLAPQPEAPAPKKSAVDMGQYTRNALFAGQKPEEAGGYLLLGDANTYGARDPRTTNATVGAGKSYDQTAEHFDIGQANDLRKNKDNNTQSGANNAATNATSRANNAANISKDIKIEGMKEAAKKADDNAGAGNWTPSAIDYASEIYRRTGQMPSVGMGGKAAQIRGAITNRAAELDRQDGKSPGDTIAGFAEYKGSVAGEQTLGRRSANAGMAVNELTNLIPTAKAVYANVARTGFVPADVLLNAYQNGTDDPNLAKAAVSINDVVNAHARAINPNGEVTDAGRAQGYALLNKAQDQVAFNAALDQMMVGAKAARSSPGQTRTEMHGDIAGKPGEAFPMPGNNAPAASGWTVEKVAH